VCYARTLCYKSTMPEPLDKQIRLRATAEEKTHLETAAGDAGYANLSDYLRHVLFDDQVLIVGDSNTSFTLVPAFSSVEAEREEAIANLQGLLRLAELARGTEAPEELPEPPAPEPALGQAQEPLPGDAGGGDWAGTPPANAPVAAPQAEQLPAPPPPLAAVPDPTPPHTGPTPHPEETYDLFLVRRSTELVLAGSTELRAGLEADAEWRAHLGQAQAPLEPVEEAAAPAAGHGFCGNCGAALAGTNFCSACGAPAA
jgi:hypothetical protein